MKWLVLVSILWAFSFGVIGRFLPGLDPAWVSWVRLGLAALAFLPLARRVPFKLGAGLMGIGAIQFGMMYWAYLSSYRFLQSHEVALFTVVTPIWVVLLSGRMSWRAGIAAGLAMAGAGVLVWGQVESEGAWMGFWLVQVSNACFAGGQLAYRAWMARRGATVPDSSVFFWMYMGGVALLSPLAMAAPSQSPTLLQWGVLGYLGLGASGVCFWLWNRGARMVGAEQLAVMNNLKIPLGVLVSIAVFGEKAAWGVLLLGAGLVGSGLWMVKRVEKIQ